MPNREQFVANQVLGEVQTELERAMTLYPPHNSRHESHSVLLEEVDEFWDEVKMNPSKMTPGQKADWKERMHKELVQVAAMAVRTIVDLRLGTEQHEQSFEKTIFVKPELPKKEVLNPSGPRYF